MMSPHFATADPSVDNDINAKRRAGFRAKMRGLFTNRVDLSAVGTL